MGHVMYHVIFDSDTSHVESDTSVLLRAYNRISAGIEMYLDTQVIPYNLNL